MCNLRIIIGLRTVYRNSIYTLTSFPFLPVPPIVQHLYFSFYYLNWLGHPHFFHYMGTPLLLWLNRFCNRASSHSLSPYLVCQMLNRFAFWFRLYCITPLCSNSFFITSPISYIISLTWYFWLSIHLEISVDLLSFTFLYPFSTSFLHALDLTLYLLYMVCV